MNANQDIGCYYSNTWRLYLIFDRYKQPSKRSLVWYLIIVLVILRNKYMSTRGDKQTNNSSLKLIDVLLYLY